MTNLRLEFSYPWLLLLLIPAAILTFLPYFRLAKRYRRTRNRVTSVVLHSIVMTLAICILAGLTFHYEIPNKDNELLLLVDASYSNSASKDDKDDFVEKVINKCGEDFKVGVIKFGYDQVYAAELSNSTTDVLQQYMQSPDPDTSATDVEAALLYANSLLTKPKTSKIVLISDGIETDGSAFSVINKIAARGIKVDTMYYPNEKTADAQIIGVTLPEAAEVGKNFNITLNVKSTVTGEDQKANVTVYDNEEAFGPFEITLDKEDTSVDFTYKVMTPGLHQLRFEMEYDGDTTKENNSYYTYLYIHVFEDILIIENKEGESDSLRNVLTDNEYKVTAISVEDDLDAFPTDVNTLCDYEQVILVNIANSDMPEGFDLILEDYVHNYGGGLFTVGGENDTDGGQIVPHAYNRDDMYNTVYQKMLPVQVVNYAPPVAVTLLIDSSGSMGSGDGSNLDRAIDGAFACLEGLTSFDYCGIATFQDDYDEELRVTPVSRRKEIEQAISDLSNESGGGTVFNVAIDGAGRALSAVDVVRRHIILVTDGMPSDTGKYESFIESNFKEKGITMSVVSIGGNASTDEKMAADAKLGGGKFYSVIDASKLAQTMYNDLMAEAVEEIAYDGDFKVMTGDYSPIISGINPKEIPVLNGYYGTKLKNGAIQPLKVNCSPLEGGDPTSNVYVPLYATWKYGNGNVGSFMSDLNGTWSDQFITNLIGQQLILGMVDSVFPNKEIEKNDLIVRTHEDNFTTQLSVYTNRTETDTVEVIVTPLSADAEAYYQERQIVVNVDDGGTRYDFDITCGGIYQIRVIKKSLNELGEMEVVAETSLYKSFSYSKEYDSFPDPETTGLVYMEELAKDGRGVVITEVLEVFASFEKTVHKVFDPRWLFAIIAITLFLLDVAVRKFKWKWIHEIIRERREKKEFIK
jgi:uncharacterized membrane protein